jgi:hypothetical protein
MAEVCLDAGTAPGERGFEGLDKYINLSPRRFEATMPRDSDSQAVFMPKTGLYTYSQASL